MSNAAVIERPQSAPSLVYMPHPMTADGRQQFGARFLEDETLGEYLERHGAKPPHSAVAVTVNGIPIPAANWENLLPRVGDQIVLRTALHGGSGGGSKILRSVALIAIAVLAVYTGGAAAAAFNSTLAGSLASAAVSIGGSILINALLPPPSATSQSTAAAAQQLAAATFSLSGGSNQARLYAPLPICVGYNKISPDLASNAYTEFSGADQYLYQAFNFGLSDFQYLADFAIGDTPISSYDGVSIEVSGPDGKLASIAGNVDSMSVQDLLNVDGWVQRTTSIDTTLIALDFASVLYYVNADGSFAPVAVNFTCQYCPTGTNAWVAFAGGAQSIVGSSQISEAVKKHVRRILTEYGYEPSGLRTGTDIKNIVRDNIRHGAAVPQTITTTFYADRIELDGIAFKYRRRERFQTGGAWNDLSIRVTVGVSGVDVPLLAVLKLRNIGIGEFINADEAAVRLAGPDEFTNRKKLDRVAG